MSHLLSEDLIGAIQQILILGKGDQGRLEYLLDILQKGKPIQDSDRKYLQIMIPLYLGPKDSESYQNNTESAIEQLQNQIKKLNENMMNIQRKGFEKYIGRKAILFFVTFFVGWDALYQYIQLALSDFIPNSILQYMFPLNLILNYFNYGQVLWVAFLILITSWPFIGLIHLIGFIKSRKISSIYKN